MEELEFPLSVVNTSELNGATQRIVETVEAETPNLDPLTVAITAEVKKFNDQLTASLNTSLKSFLTQTLKEKDENRDDGFLAFRDYIYSCVKRLNPTYRAAAEVLSPILEQHGLSLYKDAYLIETSKLNSLFIDLSTAEAQSALTVIGAVEILEELKTAQADFESVYKQRQAMQTQADFVPLGEIKPSLTANLTTLLNNINTMSRFGDKTEVYTALSEKLALIIKDTLAAARVRMTARNKKTDAPETE